MNFSRGLNPSEEEVQDTINQVDMDGSGKVGYSVFIINTDTDTSVLI